MAKKRKNRTRRSVQLRRWTMRVSALFLAFFLLVAGVTFFLTYVFVLGSATDGVTAQAETVSQLYTAQVNRGVLEDYKTFAQSIGSKTGDGRQEQFLLDKTGTLFADTNQSDGLTGSVLWDTNTALQHPDAVFTTWSKLENGTPVAVAAKAILEPDGKVAGVVWCCSPMSSAITTMIWVNVVFDVSALALMFLGIYLCRRFAKRLLWPVEEINRIAKQIAQGDFHIRLKKKRNDEIGELYDTLNDMASSLYANETMKNEFISSISHELRTPLTAIKGWAETMQGGQVSETTLDRGLSVIVGESERLSGIVEELLDFSRMQSGAMKTDRKEMDLREELDTAVTMFTERAKSEGKYLLYKEPSSLPTVYGDGNRLRQVLVNLLDNALKYTDEGGTVNVSAKAVGDDVRITVADNGCGIPPEHLPNVKRKFYKANQTVRGSGIGLALADEIVTLHGGKLDIDSHEHLGTVVQITLPTYKKYQQSIPL